MNQKASQDFIATPKKGQHKAISSLLENDITKADYNKALQYKLQNTINYVADDGSIKLYDLNIDNSSLTKYGLGIYLYFSFMKRTAIVFGIMSFIALASMIVNYQGNGISAFKNANSIMVFSVANLPEVALSSTNSTDATIIAQVQANNELNNADWIKNMKVNHKIVSLFDVLYTLIFICHLILFSRHANNVINDYNENYTTPSNYALIVRGFPKTFINDSELHDFLTKYTDVFEVKLARNYQNTLLLHQDEAKIMLNIQMEEMKEGTKFFNKEKIVNLKEELSELKMNLSLIVAKKLSGNEGAQFLHDTYPSLLGCLQYLKYKIAFIIFESAASKTDFVKQYKKLTDLPWYNFILGSNKKVIPKEHLLLSKYRLQFEGHVDTPSNVKWENIEIDNRVGRQCVVVLVVLCLMLMTFGIVLGANIVKPTNPTQCDKTTASFNLTEFKSYIATVNDTTPIKSCFCTHQSIDDLYDNSELTSYCYETIKSYSINTGISIGSAFIIVIVNTLLNVVVRRLGIFLRYPSLSKELSGIMVNLFIFMFINTALITLLLNANIFGFKPAVIISSPITPLMELQMNSDQTFSTDFDREWYVNIGSKLCTTWIINSVSPHLVQLLFLPFSKCLANIKVNNSVIQRDMNNNMVGPDFLLTTYYSQALNTIFVTLFYCSGMPLMIILGGLSIATQYFTYKYRILRFARKPPAYDEQLHRKSMSIIPIGILFHVAIGIYMFGNPNIFPSDQTLNLKSYTTGIPYTNTESSLIASRLINTPWMTALFFIYLFYLILNTFFYQPLSQLYDKIIGGSNKISQVPTNSKKYSQIIEDLSATMLCTYEIRANETYRDIINVIDYHVGLPQQSKTIAQSIKNEDTDKLVDIEN